MLISHKNAGSSVTSALLPFVANKLRLKANYALYKLGFSHLYPRPYTQHIKTSECIEKMGKVAFDKYFSFTIVRNPWIGRSHSTIMHSRKQITINTE